MFLLKGLKKKGKGRKQSKSEDRRPVSAIISRRKFDNEWSPDHKSTGSINGDRRSNNGDRHRNKLLSSFGFSKSILINFLKPEMTAHR